MDLEGKRVCVVGAGKSGIAAADLLIKRGAAPILYDGNVKLAKEDILLRLTDRQGASVILGEPGEDFPDGIDLVVMSPGVPTDLPLIERMRARNIPIWGEVELAYRLGKGTLLAITGTNGKTTTTSLLGEIMKAYHPDTFVVGNIGIPYTEVVSALTDDSITVAEISSFQLETTETFHPQISAITNITEDHMNRHHTMEEYIRVKELIAKNQTPEDTCVLNYEDDALRSFGETLRAHVIYFSSLRPLREGIYLAGDQIIWRMDGEEVPVIQVNDLKILGRHNYENVMVALACAISAGVPLDTIREVLKSFAGVAHRIEYVEEKHGVVYYNDSKGTNPDAAIKGIQAMKRPTVLIGGGYDKESGYDTWIQAFDGKVKTFILIGQTREKIRDAALGLGFPAEDIILCENLKEAVRKAAEHAAPGDAVLLSPACASWGQFADYEERGDMFKAYVRKLA